MDVTSKCVPKRVLHSRMLVRQDLPAKAPQQGVEQLRCSRKVCRQSGRGSWACHMSHHDGASRNIAHHAIPVADELSGLRVQRERLLLLLDLKEELRRQVTCASVLAYNRDTFQRKSRAAAQYRSAES